jgi:hypothetical protein
MSSERVSAVCHWCLAAWLSVAATSAGGVDEKNPQAGAAIRAAVLDLANATSTDLTRDQTDERFRKVVLLGFKAVPALIAHLNDPQPTKVRPDLDVPYVLRIRDVVMELLQNLAGRELLDAARMGEDLERTVPRSAVEAWFTKARRVGEERYLVEHVLEDDRSINQTMLFIIANKYPERLAQVYRTLLDERPKMQSYAMPRAIMASALAPKRKRELIGYGLSSKELKHRVWALRALRRLDAYEYDMRLLRELQTIPATPQGEFWRCPEATTASLACLTNNPVVWEALEKAARRAHVGLRMEFLARMYCSGETITTRQQQLRFLAGFLGDKTIRDVSTAPRLFSGPSAGASMGDHDFPRLEVRNYAAFWLSQVLPLELGTPRANWDAKQWKAFREAIGQALRAEGIRPAVTENSDQRKEKRGKEKKTEAGKERIGGRGKGDILH